MLPGPLVSNYQQYKQDTDAVASWLASTAKKLGYKLSDLSEAKNIPTDVPVKLKGRARRDAKRLAKETTAQLKTSKSNYVVAIRDFIPLATFIAASDKSIASVPRSFLTTLNRVIAIRSGFPEQLQVHGEKTNPKSDRKHGHFVGVLEAVRQVLQDGLSPPAATAADAAPSHDASERLTNRFEALEIHEPSQEFMDAPERPPKADDDDNVYEAEPQNSLEDAVAAYTMMINDLNRIRSRINWIWEGYQSGHFDVAAASVATDTAIGLARSLTEDVTPLFITHGGCWRIANIFFVASCRMKGYTEEEICLAGKDGFNHDLYDIADDMYMCAHLLLISFVDVLEPGILPLYKEGSFGTYDPTTDRSTKTGPEKFREDQALLMSFFTELMTVVRIVHNYPVKDEFLRGMKELDTTRQVPFYLVFAAQTFLDIHHILRSTASHAFDYMSNSINFMSSSLQEHVKFHENLKIDTWTSSNDHVLQMLLKEIETIRHDPVWMAKAKQYQQHGIAPASIDRHRILEFSPVLAGLMLCHFRMRIYDAGIAVADTWGSITYSAHLYNGLQLEKLLLGHWDDMDIAQTLLGSFYVGERPKSIEDHVNKFCLQIGLSLAALKNFKGRGGRRGGRTPAVASRAGPRGIKPSISVWSMFRSRYLESSEQANWTPEQVDEVISCSGWEEIGSEEDGTLVLEQIDESQKLIEKRRNHKAKPRKNFVDGARLTPDQLVRGLLLALQAQTLEISFPLLMLHRFSWRLLRAVKAKCDPVLRELNSWTHLERENQLPFLVGYIFMAGSGMNDGSGKDDRLMRAAAEALNEMIEQGAHKFVTTMMLERLGLNVQWAEETDDGEVINKGTAAGHQDENGM